MRVTRQDKAGATFRALQRRWAPGDRPSPPRSLPGKPRQPRTLHCRRGSPRRAQGVHGAQQHLEPGAGTVGMNARSSRGWKPFRCLYERNQRTQKKGGAAAIAPGFLGRLLPLSAIYTKFRSGRLWTLGGCTAPEGKAAGQPTARATAQGKNYAHMLRSVFALANASEFPSGWSRPQWSHLESDKQIPSGYDLLLNGNYQVRWQPGVAQTAGFLLRPSLSPQLPIRKSRNDQPHLHIP